MNAASYSKSAQKMLDAAAANGWTADESWWTPDGMAGALVFTRGDGLFTIMVRFRENGSVAVAGIKQPGDRAYVFLYAKDVMAILTGKDPS